MPRRPSPLVAGLLVAVSTALAGPVADDGAEAVFKEKGLRKIGTAIVLPAEAEVQKKLDDARHLSRQMNAALSQQRAFDQELRDGKRLMRELTEQRIALNQQLPQAGSPAEHNQIVAALNTLTDRLSLIVQQQNDAQGKGDLDAQAARRREEFITAILDLRQRVDAATRLYEGLAADASLTRAIDDLNGRGKVKYALGPSRSFLANVKTLERVEATVLTETVDLRKEGGIFWIDVTFGKVTRKMAFDTGASSVVLPSDLAAEIGLRPGKDDPTVKCQVADGSIVEAKSMTIPQMRVGKFTVKDVQCTVMPADKKDVPPLLGQTFQKHFSFKFSPDTGKLFLSRVEAPEAASATPKKAATKGSARPPAGKRQAKTDGDI